jgi:putrescine aminotransferase
MSLDAALSMSREDIVKYHKEYLNSDRVLLVGLVAFTHSFAKAEGTRVWNDAGNEYLDFLGAYGAINIGHNAQKFLGVWARPLVNPIYFWQHSVPCSLGP